jgi:hypothetical protein
MVNIDSLVTQPMVKTILTRAERCRHTLVRGDSMNQFAAEVEERP